MRKYVNPFEKPLKGALLKSWGKGGTEDDSERGTASRKTERRNDEPGSFNSDRRRDKKVNFDLRESLIEEEMESELDSSVSLF